MANHYLQFSFVIDVTEAERAWIEDQWASEDLVELTDQVEIEQWGSQHAICFSAREGGVEEMVDFLVEFVTRFPDRGPVGFTWAHTCTKMIPDEFGGGAVVVAPGRQPEFLNTGEWVVSKIHSMTGKGIPAMKRKVVIESVTDNLVTFYASPHVAEQLIAQFGVGYYSKIIGAYTVVVDRRFDLGEVVEFINNHEPEE